jgi:hypothetical protein
MPRSLIVMGGGEFGAAFAVSAFDVVIPLPPAILINRASFRRTKLSLGHDDDASST